MAVLYPVPSPNWLVEYQGVNISGRIEPMVLSVEYASALDAESGEVQIELEDRGGRWRGPWFPAQGDVVHVEIGYSGEPLVNCGNFEVDEMEYSGAPDVMHLRCLATYITPALRTRNNVGYENQTLIQIATKIAGKYGLTVVDGPVPLNLSFSRISQSRETDLEFLHRIAAEHGYDFAIRGTQLIFYSRTTLEAQAPVLTISRKPMPEAISVLQGSGYRFKSKTHQTYKACQVTYFNPTTKSLIVGNATDANAKTGDTLKLQVRCDNGVQATLKAQAALHSHNMLGVTVTLSTIGDRRLAAGNNVNVVGFGQYDGTYLIEKARHKLDRKGYTSEVEARNVSSS